VSDNETRDRLIGLIADELRQQQPAGVEVDERAETLLREQGYTDDDIEKMRKEWT
jgi:hypothetical protein